MALEISFRKNTDREKNFLETPFTSSGCHRKFDFFFFKGNNLLVCIELAVLSLSHLGEIFPKP